jgi:hypothetical protein
MSYWTLCKLGLRDQVEKSVEQLWPILFGALGEERSFVAEISDTGAGTHFGVLLVEAHFLEQGPCEGEPAFVDGLDYDEFGVLRGPGTNDWAGSSPKSICSSETELVVDAPREIGDARTRPMRPKRPAVRMIAGKGTAKKKMPMNAATARVFNVGLLRDRLSMRITASTRIASTASLSPNSSAVTAGKLPQSA